MGAPKGSNNGKGVKGRSGRKSAREEFAKAREAHKIFFEEQDQEKLEDKIRSGRFSIKDRFILTALEGDERILNKAYQKAVPDVVEGDIKGNVTISFDPTFGDEKGQ